MGRCRVQPVLAPFELDDLVVEIASAAKWIATNVYTGSREPHSKKLSKDGEGNREFANITARRPAGLRDVLYADHPAVQAMRRRLHAMGISTDPLAVPTPTSRDQIRTYLSARAPFMFDRGLERVMATQSLQTDEIAEAFRHVCGWNFDDLVAVFEFAWDNHRHGGKGGTSFDRLWLRGLSGFIYLYRSADKPLSLVDAAIGDLCHRMRIRNDKAISAVVDVAAGFFEIERLIDCLEGIAAHRLKLKSRAHRWHGKLSSSASLFLISLKGTQNELSVSLDLLSQDPSENDPAAGLQPLKRGLESDVLKTESTFVGSDDLGYALSIFSSLGRHKVATYRRHRVVPEHNILRSRIYRLALNTVAHSDWNRALGHLLKRTSGPDSKAIRRQSSNAAPGSISFFGAHRPISKSLVTLLTFLTLEDVGASYVENVRIEEKRRIKGGFFDPEINPAVRAFFYPNGWSVDVFAEHLLMKRTNLRDALGLLHSMLVVEERKGHLNTAAILAGRLLECIVTPLTMRAFAVRIPDAKCGTTQTNTNSGDFGCDKNKNLPDLVEVDPLPQYLTGPERAQISGLGATAEKTRTQAKVRLKRE